MLLFPNRLYSSWHLSGTPVVRTASKCLLKQKGVFKGYGRNAQNFSDVERRIQIPDPEMVFVQTDQSGADALICAYLFPPGKFRDLFINGIKPHTYAALNIFAEIFTKQFKEVPELLALPISELMKHPKTKEVLKYVKSANDGIYYFLGKKTIHAANYGEQAGTFSKSVMVETEGKVIIPIADSKLFLLKHHKRFPEIQAYHQWIEAKIRRDRILTNLFGFPRTFYNSFSPELFRSAYAYIPAATVAAITKIALTKMYQYIRDNNLSWEVLNDCHDSMMSQCPPEEALACAAKQEEFIEADLTSLRGEKFKMKSETTFGWNWGSYDPEHNPKGMMEKELFIKGI